MKSAVAFIAEGCVPHSEVQRSDRQMYSLPRMSIETGPGRMGGAKKHEKDNARGGGGPIPLGSAAG